MFNFLRRSEDPNKDDASQTVRFKLSGMHCSSCAVNIDLALEDVAGVVTSKTNFARSVTEIIFNPEQITTDSLIKEIDNLGYKATLQ